MLKALGRDPGLYSLHSLRRGGATTAYANGSSYELIKRHGLWRSHCFWDYITLPAGSQSAVAATLADAVANTSGHT